ILRGPICFLPRRRIGAVNSVSSVSSVNSSRSLISLGSLRCFPLCGRGSAPVAGPAAPRGAGDEAPRRGVALGALRFLLRLLLPLPGGVLLAGLLALLRRLVLRRLPDRVDPVAEGVHVAPRLDGVLHADPAGEHLLGHLLEFAAHVG